MAKRLAIKKRAFKQSPADSLLEEMDKSLDTKGFTGSPGQALSKPPDPDKDPVGYKKYIQRQMKRSDTA